jgi:hypothetical protein
VRDQLVTKEIKINPLLRATPLGATQNSAVETARFGKIVNRHCQMKWLQHAGAARFTLQISA